ncbi:Gfo/Idh/MocA family oxidoreductase [Priestia megaterium]
MKKPVVALIGASHWHVPLYINGIKQLGLKVCGVHDADITVARALAEDLKSIPFDNVDKLIETKPDFVFAFETHHQMPYLAKKLIDHQIAFAIEKPVGLNYAQVIELADLARDKGVFCSIPLVWRYSEAVASLKSRICPEQYEHIAFRFVAGPPERYLHNGSPWMLDASEAGGGCMTNLGVHFLDLALELTQSNDLKVLSAIHKYSHKFSIEDYSTALLTTENGTSVVLETGYAFPMDNLHKRENTWTLVTGEGYYSLTDGQLALRNVNNNAETISLTTDSDDLYPVFVRETLREWAEGRPPLIDLYHMARVRNILDKINENAAAHNYGGKNH